MPGCPTLIPRFDGTRFAGQFVSGVSLHSHTGKQRGAATRSSAGNSSDLRGDRPGCEANSVLNLSQANSFEEFVQEVREGKRSEIVLMPQYFEPLPLRLIENAGHALSDAPGENSGGGSG